MIGLLLAALLAGSTKSSINIKFAATTQVSFEDTKSIRAGDVPASVKLPEALAARGWECHLTPVEIGLRRAHQGFVCTNRIVSTKVTAAAECRAEPGSFDSDLLILSSSDKAVSGIQLVVMCAAVEVDQPEPDVPQTERF